MATQYIVQHRTATAKQWEESNIVPYAGELVIEDCQDGTYKTKLGDGINVFKDLPYQNLDEELSELKTYVDGKVVDGLFYEDNKLYLTLNGEIVSDPVEIVGGGGGGSGSSYNMRLVNGMSSSTLTVALADKTMLTASFYEKYGDDSTGVNGTLEVLYKLSTNTEWISWKTQSIAQNTPFSVDVASILSLDAVTDIKFNVVGGESGLSRTLTYHITQVEASITAVNFNSSAVYTGNVNFQYRCIGRNLQKTVTFEIDGEVCATVDVGTSHNSILSHTIQLVGKYDYGAHDLRVYFTTEDGAVSNVLKYTLLYNNGTSIQPMVGVVCQQDEITYGDILSIDYVVYTPGQETTDELNIRVYDDEAMIYETTQRVDIVNNTQYTWNGTAYPLSGVVYVEFKSGDTVKTVSVYINELQTEYDLAQVETSLVYMYNANGRSNNDANKNMYTYEYTTANGVTTNIEGLFSDFNWVSNGYVDSESLTLSGDARHTIAFPMFSTSYVDKNGQTINLESATGATVTTNGRTFEIEFKVSNVTDINAHIIKCMSADHAGFVITPQTCYLLSSNGADVKLDETGFIENEDGIAAAYIKDNTRIRLSFVIEPRGSVKYTLEDGTEMSGQCVNIYINGQYANSFVYPDSARFTSTEYITMGSNTCILNVYDIRIYNRGLNETEILQNYKASPLSVQDKILRFEDNDILTDDGDVDYYEAVKKYNCLLITGELSPYKGAKKNGGSILTRPDGSGSYTTEFNLMDVDTDGNYVCYNNVQGTSSVKFPVKNYKFYLVKMGDDGETEKVKYSLKGLDDEGNPISIPESTLCWKGDYMSSDHANTFNANLADTLFGDITESQREDPRVQNTIYGFRCLLFIRDSVDGKIYFAGDGALNNDKGNTKTFGLECSTDSGNESTRQKWEYLNNTEAVCSFLTDKLFEPMESKGKIVKRVTLGLESTYPDQGDLKDAGLEPKYDYIQTLYTWICQRANFWEASTDTVETPYVYQGVEYYTERAYRKAIFINEFEKHFNKNHALVYYLFIEFVALCDNRAKNMFLRCENVYTEQLLDIDGNSMSIYDAIDLTTGEVNADMIDWENSTFAVWLCDLYDLDSCFGVENSGYMQIPYYADWNYHLNGTQKFNGRESLLWLMIEEALADDIQAKAQELTEKGVGEGGLNYETLYDMHIKNNAKLVCPAVVNRDMNHKYTDPWIEGFVDYSTEGYPVRHISDYKYLQRGSRTEQKDAFIYRRSNMLYSKYQCNKFLNNNINFRVGTNGGVVSSESGITITANQALYPAVKYGDGDAAVISGAKTAAGVPSTITKPGTTDSDKVGFSDTIYIAGGTFLTDIGDISKFRPYELQLQNATGLRKLTIGSAEEGYENNQLKNIDTSGCKLLEELNIMGCTSLGYLDLSRNGLLNKLYAANSSVQSVTLPNGGVIEELYLGDIVDLEILNQTNLQVFECTSLDSLTKLRIENTPNVSTLEIVADRLAQLTGGLRLVGINETIADASVFDLLTSDVALGKYIDTNGILLEDMTLYPYISGSVHIETLSGVQLQKIKEYYPYLNITYDTLTATLIYMSEDGTTELYRETILNGGDAVDPVENGSIIMPTKYSTAQYHFIYGGWSMQPNSEVDDMALKNVAIDRTVYVAFDKEIRSYIVKFYNGDILLQTSTVEYGKSASYDGATPIKTNTSIPDLYDFVGWEPSFECIVGDLDCYAQFEFNVTNIYKFLLFDFEYTTNTADSTMSITKYIGNAVAGEVQSTYENNEVISIAGFEESHIEYIILPITLRTISANTFQYCKQLMSINIPMNVTTIGDNAFRGCSNLEQLTVSADNAKYHSANNCIIETASDTLIIGCNSSVIPTDGSVTRIGYGAFYGRDGLTEIVIPDGVTEIDNTAFTNCSTLADVMLPETLVNIGAMAFYGCGMNEIVIPDSVQTIRMYAFSICNNLTTVTIGSGITSIHAQAFDNSPNITTINVPWAEGEVANAPWGATNATINYEYIKK